MTVSWTDRRGLAPARVKIGVPWPVNPVEFPLSGPTRGPVYTPPPTFGGHDMPPKCGTLCQMVKLYAIMAALWFAGGLIVGLIARGLWWLVFHR